MYIWNRIKTTAAIVSSKYYYFTLYLQLSPPCRCGVCGAGCGVALPCSTHSVIYAPPAVWPMLTHAPPMVWSMLHPKYCCILYKLLHILTTCAITTLVLKLASTLHPLSSVQIPDMKAESVQQPSHWSQVHPTLTPKLQTWTRTQTQIPTLA